MVSGQQRLSFSGTAASAAARAGRPRGAVVTATAGSEHPQAGGHEPPDTLMVDADVSASGEESNETMHCFTVAFTNALQHSNYVSYCGL